MKLRAFLRHELGYRLRQPSTWVYLAALWIGTLVAIHATDPANNRVVNAPATHAQIVALLNFFAMVITAGIFGEAAVRDAQTGMQPLFSTAPIDTLGYLGGRFAACFIVNLVLLAGVPLLVALAYTFPWLGHFNWSPLRVAAFVQPFVLFTVPNLFIAAAVAYTIAALTRNTLATYLGGALLVVLYVLVVNQGLGSDTVENLVDPFALGALQRITSYWTPIERETRLIGYPGILLLNRAIWIGLAASLLVFLHAKFSFTQPGMSGRRRKTDAPAPDGLEPRPVHAIAVVPHAQRHFAGRTRAFQLLAVARHALRDIVRNRVFLAIVIASIPWTWAIGWQVGAIVFDTDTWPVTHLVAGSLNGIAVQVLMIFLITLIAGELVWREREVGAGDIGAAAPVPDWVPILGRFLALIGVIAILQGVYTLSGIALQAAQGYYRFELGLWLQLMFGIQLVEYVIFAALAMAMHVVINHKSVAHVATLGLYILTQAGGPYFPILYDNLVQYSGDAGIVFSDMSRFGPFLEPWGWFNGYWAAWALLLTVVATVFWIRSSESGVRARLRLARARIAGGAGRAALLAIGLILATGGFVFYNTHVLNDYDHTDEARARAVAYEKTYKRFADAPVPTVTANVMRVEIFPDRRIADIAGHFVLRNETSRAIDSVHVAMNDAVSLQALDFAGGARLVVDDSALRHRIYQLASPLEPGDSTRMTFAVRFAPRGFTNDGPRTEVVGNGTYFDRRWLPTFGYQAGRELGNDRLRGTYGLGPRTTLPSPRDTGVAVRSRMDDDGTSYVHMDVTIGTAVDQIAITPGRLVREWSEHGRRYFRYVTDAPVPHGAPVFSARYAVREDAWRGIPLRIYHHPTHTFNIDRIFAAMKATLDYNSAAFGPFPYHELRVVEFPRYGSFARAHPHTIAFGEGSAFLTRIDEDAGFDRPFYVIAHETGHQWWGNSLRGARLRGTATLSETLAGYSAMMAMEKTFGRPALWRYYGYEMERYLGRRHVSDAPLTEATTEAHVYYSKGALAMYTLRDFIGEDRVTLALRRFYERHADRTPPFPTSLDLMAEFRAVTPDSLRYLIADLFETITLWELKTDSAMARQVDDSTFDVTLAISARKVRADSAGIETEAPMHDLVDVGVFGEQPGDTLYLQRHRIRGGAQTVTVRVTGRPDRAGVDPYHRMIKREQRPMPRVTVTGAPAPARSR